MKEDIKPMYVVCFYWEGERWQEYGVYPKDVTKDKSFQKHLVRVGHAPIELVQHYINNLYQGATRWAEHPFRFICFTNKDMELDSGI